MGCYIFLHVIILVNCLACPFHHAVFLPTKLYPDIVFQNTVAGLVHPSRTTEHAYQLLQEWQTPTPPPITPINEWKPKNREVSFPIMEAEKSIPFELWKSYGFPTHPVPDEVVTHVNKEYWKSETERLQVTPGCEQAAEIMSVVLDFHDHKFAHQMALKCIFSNIL